MKKQLLVILFFSTLACLFDQALAMNNKQNQELVDINKEEENDNENHETIFLDTVKQINKNKDKDKFLIKLENLTKDFNFMQNITLSTCFKALSLVSKNNFDAVALLNHACFFKDIRKKSCQIEETLACNFQDSESAYKLLKVIVRNGDQNSLEALLKNQSFQCSINLDKIDNALKIAQQYNHREIAKKLEGIITQTLITYQFTDKEAARGTFNDIVQMGDRNKLRALLKNQDFLKNININDFEYALTIAQEYKHTKIVKKLQGIITQILMTHQFTDKEAARETFNDIVQMGNRNKLKALFKNQAFLKNIDIKDLEDALNIAQENKHKKIALVLELGIYVKQNPEEVSN